MRIGAFGGVYPVISLEYPIVSQTKVNKSIKTNRYSIMLYRKYMDRVVLPNMNFTNTQLKNTNAQ